MGAAPSGVYPSNVPMVEIVVNTVETCAAKVMSNNNELTEKEVATKFMKEVDPHLTFF